MILSMFPDHPYWLATNAQGELVSLWEMMAFSICEKKKEIIISRMIQIPVKAFFCALFLYCYLKLYSFCVTLSKSTGDQCKNDSGLANKSIAQALELHQG